ncbi:MAG: heme-copper oxidase subunit III, partial [Cyanobium sp.]
MTSTTPATAAELLTAAATNGGEGHQHEHPDLRLFGLATFLVADGMTFAGF